MKHAHRGIALALPFACLLVAALPGAAAADVRLIVKHEPGLTRTERGDIRDDAGVSFAGALAVPGTEVVTVATARRASALRALNADPGVEYAEPDATYRALSNDDMFDQQWGLENTGQRIDRREGVAGDDMDVPAAWGISHGAGQTVAVVDTGVDESQSDLQGRIAAGGRSFLAGVTSSDDDEGHGTAVAGVIAANYDNGEGIAGVAPEAQVLPLKALGGAGGGSATAIGDAFEYAGALGLRVVNASLGGKDYSQYMRDAIARHPNTLYVVAAGNGEDYRSRLTGDDNDVDGPEYPCNFPEPNVICVGATDNRDSVLLNSNWGAVSVDLFAPGWNIPTTGLQTPGGDDYPLATGTSMAAAMLSGEAALVSAARPTLNAASAKWLMLASVDHIAGAAGRSVTGGRADAYAALTDPALDSDGDGWLDVIDDCSKAADAAQADADADGTGDACDPMPRGLDQDGDGRPALDDRCPTVPAATADGCPAPLGDHPGDPSQPKLGALKVLMLKVSLQPARCRRDVPCRRSAKVSVRLSRTAKVALKVERKVRTHGRTRWTRVYTRTLSVTAAARTVTVKGRGGRSLAIGSYRVSATPSGVAKATTYSFRVR